MNIAIANLGKERVKMLVKKTRMSGAGVLVGM
nr:MAG TPA: hypothetical protein [Caudoviricetes sp.]